ncbi:SDR family NAD(P)-dependent oxidoreductase [Nocardia rhamnosiphila]|uniref:SDR family NAD(P)-dependent oxidoreductase n=1 Tax=Nocardia rhamnosiphila TaxID=426716 RepID=UPI0033C8C98B
MTDTVVWITGATRGLGAGLARTCPYPQARIINASRSPHPDFENIRFDLGDPSSWSALRASFDEVLNGFTGKRAIFVHNALFEGSTGYAGEMDEDLYYRDVIGNAAAPLVFADWFLRAVRPGYESGILLMSSAAARMPIEGHSVYGAAKAGVEQWVRVVRRERATRGTGPWVVAVRPGMVDSATTRREAELDPAVYPMAVHLGAAFEAGEALSPDDAARDIWAAMPPPPDTSVLLFGAPPSGVLAAGSADPSASVESGS